MAEAGEKAFCSKGQKYHCAFFKTYESQSVVWSLRCPDYIYYGLMGPFIFSFFFWLGFQWFTDDKKTKNQQQQQQQQKNKSCVQDRLINNFKDENLGQNQGWEQFVFKSGCISGPKDTKLE